MNANNKDRGYKLLVVFLLFVLMLVLGIRHGLFFSFSFSGLRAALHEGSPYAFLIALLAVCAWLSPYDGSEKS